MTTVDIENLKKERRRLEAYARKCLKQKKNGEIEKTHKKLVKLKKLLIANGDTYSRTEWKEESNNPLEGVLRGA